MKLKVCNNKNEEKIQMLYETTRKKNLKKRESGWNSDGVKETKTRETLE
jgi:hypothetical protein